MTYTLLIADRSYSSWSLRGWLAFAAFGIPVDLRVTRLYQPGFAEDLRAFAPARTVPVVRTPEGALLTDSIAIAEELAQRHPQAGHWPSDPAQRCLARSLTAEMHSGFTTLRGDCPMNLRQAYSGVPISDALQADLDRLDAIWGQALGADRDGPWLFGRYTMADAFFAPVAARVAGYGLPLSDAAQDYVAAHLAHPDFVAWRAAGLNDAPQSAYDMPWQMRGWPGP